MAVYQKEAGVAHGRGFSEADPLGFLGKMVGFFPRPASAGSPQEFTADAGTNVISCAGHGYLQNDQVRVSNSGGALPSGLAIDTSYWIIYVDSGSFKLASTFGNSKALSEIDITGAGTGTHSILKYGGGPSWYIREDKSNPVAMVFTADASTEELTIAAGHNIGTGDLVWVSNTGGALPTGLTASTTYYAIRVSATKLKLASSMTSAMAGTAINLTSNGTGTSSIVMVEKYIVFCDTASPTVNDVDTGPSGGPPKFIKASMLVSEAGYIRIQFYCWWSTTRHSGYGLWAGYRITTSDDADFAYDARGGAETMIIDSRIGTAWSCAGITEWTGDAELTEGTDKFGRLQSGVTAGTLKVLQLAAGEAANFTVNNYYFIFCFDGHSWVNCCKVTATNTGSDQITVDTLGYAFPAGAVIGAYVHRWMAFGNGTASFLEGIGYIGRTSKIPYTNAVNNTYIFHNQTSYIFGGAYAGNCLDFLSRVAPNRKGYWGTNDIYVVEGQWENDQSGNATTGAHEGYGVLKNIKLSNVGTMAPYQDSRTVQGLDWLYIHLASSIFYGGSSAHAVCFLNTISVS